MKKAGSWLVVLVLTIAVMLSGVTIAYAGTLEEECDLVFRKALEEILLEEAVTETTIKVVKEPLYDLHLDALGFMYHMEYGMQKGFAVAVNSNGLFEVTEFYLEADSPYEGYTGQRIYAGILTYLVYADEVFVETSSGLVVDDLALLFLKQNALYSGGVIVSGSETIYYTNKTTSKYELALVMPAYTPLALDNACVPATGANILGYWTRYYPELIPNFVPGYSVLQHYMYKEDPVEVNPVIETLYGYMGTNQTEPGTTIAGFRTGMSRYVSEKGKSISYTSCMQSGSFNYSATKQTLQSGLPLALFVDQFKVVSFANTEESDFMNYWIAYAPHAMAGFGYNEITYTLTNGQTRMDTYLRVSTGLVGFSRGYYNINYNTQIDECYAVQIY